MNKLPLKLQELKHLLEGIEGLKLELVKLREEIALLRRVDYLRRKRK